MKRSGMVRAALAAIFMIASAGVAAARDVRVAIDSSTPLRLSEAAQGVAIGNSSIAGVSVQNERLLFVTGRSYGATSLTIVGQEGRILFSGRVIVTPDESGSVFVMRGTDMSRMTCAPICRPHPDIGDSADSFARATQQSEAHAGAAGR